MACKQLTFREAAESLQQELRGFPWLVSVGMGRPKGEETLYVYVTSLKQPKIDELRSGYRGFPVLIEKTGRFRPAI